MVTNLLVKALRASRKYLNDAEKKALKPVIDLLAASDALYLPLTSQQESHIQPRINLVIEALYECGQDAIALQIQINR